MYRRLIKPILFSLTIERAHRAVLVLLRIVGLIPGGRWLLRKCYAVEHPALEREVFGIRFPNPVGLAAGFDRNGEAFRELAAMGFGFVEVGTVTPRAQGGNPRPRVFRLPKDRAIVQRIGLQNRGLERMIQHLRRTHEGVIVGCNIGKNTATPPENAACDYLKLFRNLYQYADYFTVNISCDNSCHEGACYSREHVLQILDPLFDFRRGQNQYRPIMLKVSPDLSDEAIDRISEILLTTPLDGVVATNGTYRREGLRTSRTGLDKIGSGRLGGAPLTARATEIVRRIHTRSGGNFPIIGVGGLMTPADVKAMLDAGADLVQLYTGYVYEGPRLVKEICRELIADAQKQAAQEEPAPASEEEGTALPDAERTTVAGTDENGERPSPSATAKERPTAKQASPAPGSEDAPAAPEGARVQRSATERASSPETKRPSDTAPDAGKA